MQKIALVCSALGKEAFEQAGIPPVRISDLGALAESDGVEYGSAMRSWNPALIGQMTRELVLKGAEKGDKLFLTPDLKTCVNPYEGGLSEDPYLNGEVGGEIVRAIKSTGAAAGLYRVSASEKDIAYLDAAENATAVRELFVKPFTAAAAKYPCDAVFTDPSREGREYYRVNRTIFMEAQDGLFGDVMVVGDCKMPATGAVSLLSGKVTLGGSAISVERAAKRYEQLCGYEKEGSVSGREIEESLRDGSAIDGQKLDLLTDEVIDFALTCDGLDITADIFVRGNSVGNAYVGDAAETYESDENPNARLQTSEGSEDKGDEAENNEEAGGGEEENNEKSSDGGESGAYWLRRAATESIVLLKNNGVLPLKEGAEIALIGDAYADVGYISGKFSVKGKARGYDRTRARSEYYLPAALRAANNADFVIAFLSPDYTGRELALPPNRIALLDALKKGGKKIIAVVTGDLPVDMSFDGYADALLVAPSDCAFAGEALADVLCGEENPSGRLTRTSYDGADSYFRDYRAVREKGSARLGTFSGYRRYTTLGERLRYPFGFGLSYTRFEYSDLRISDGGAAFTLKNCGERDGYEVVQMYVGVPVKSRFAPSEQLRGFLKVFLRAGESKKITLPFDDGTFESYDTLLCSDNVEAGEYRIYIGSSAQDIKLEGKIKRAGAARMKLSERASDYFPDGNLKDVGEVGAANRIKRTRDNTPDTIKKARTAAFYALPALALLFFMIVSTLILSYALDYIVLSTLDKVMAEWLLYVIAVGVLALLPLVGSMSRRRLSRVRTFSLALTPVLLAVCFILGGILSAHKGGLAEEIAFRVVTCLAVGVPLCAVVALILDRQLMRAKAGKNRWDKYYFGRGRVEKSTEDSEFEQAFALCEEEKTRAKADAVSPPSSLPERETVQLYDGKLSYSRMLGDMTKYLAEGGLLVKEDSLKNYVAAIFSTRFIIVPAGCGAALATAAAGYFGRKAYIDNAVNYSSYGDLFKVWRQSEMTSYPTALSLAIARAWRESAFLHTAILRHVNGEQLENLFGPFVDVLAGRKATLPTAGGKQITLPYNLLMVVELEGDLSQIPASLAEVAATLSPECSDTSPAAVRTVLQSVGYETFEAMSRPVRDYYPLGEELWKKVDELDSGLTPAHIGNRLWLKLETHAAVMCAFGNDGEDALDCAMAAELSAWLGAAANVDGAGLKEVIVAIFGEENSKRTLAAVKRSAENAKEDRE